MGHYRVSNDVEIRLAKFLKDRFGVENGWAKGLGNPNFVGAYTFDEALSILLCEAGY